MWCQWNILTSKFSEPNLTKPILQIWSGRRLPYLYVFLWSLLVTAAIPLLLPGSTTVAVGKSSLFRLDTRLSRGTEFVSLRVIGPNSAEAKCDSLIRKLFFSLLDIMFITGEPKRLRLAGNWVHSNWQLLHDLFSIKFSFINFKCVLLGRLLLRSSCRRIAQLPLLCSTMLEVSKFLGKIQLNVYVKI